MMNHREALQQPAYPHPSMYGMLQGQGPRLHPVMSALPLRAGQLQDCFNLTYPFLLQNGNMYGPARLPPGMPHASATVILFACIEHDDTVLPLAKSPRNVNNKCKPKRKLEYHTLVMANRGLDLVYKGHRSHKLGD